jgi:hypothetical protein
MWSWSVHHTTSTAFLTACARWASIEPVCSLNEEWMCIAILKAVAPPKAIDPERATGLDARASGFRVANNPAAAMTDPAPIKVRRLTP